MKLPETRPRGDTVPKDPSVVDEEPQKDGNFGRQQGTGEQREAEPVDEQVQDSESSRVEGEPDDPPPAETPPLYVVQRFHDGFYSWNALFRTRQIRTSKSCRTARKFFKPHRS